MELAPVTDAGRAGLAALLAAPASALVAFDYDGTLSPIVADPADARPAAGVVEALVQLGTRIGTLAVITGRPARQAVDLAALDSPGAPGRLVVLGHYGVERWDAETGVLTTATPPAGLALVRRQLGSLLAQVGVDDAVVEDKGLAVAVHVRRCAAPEAAYRALLGPLIALAARAGLAAEPGRHVIELRSVGMDKGRALSALLQEVDAKTVMFTGDDLGDLAAFDAIDAWRSRGRPGLLVCSGSDEVTALAERADLVVEGPSGVHELIVSLTSRLMT